ncbi:uncharacterized protein BJX67DRAFT_226826 [Aspergillus lucknowensis]|uniref:Uncharacterized protein n=1 Tax=Aspergillus lucknowensis TaxID=176173 RepID=A0ABR4LIG3_9EURO
MAFCMYLYVCMERLPPSVFGCHHLSPIFTCCSKTKQHSQCLQNSQSRFSSTIQRLPNLHLEETLKNGAAIPHLRLGISAVPVRLKIFLPFCRRRSPCHVRSRRHFSSSSQQLQIDRRGRESDINFSCCTSAAFSNRRHQQDGKSARDRGSFMIEITF